MTWPDLQPHKWPRPGSNQPWMIPLALWCVVGAMMCFSPWRENAWAEALNRLPNGLSEDQMIVSRAFRHSILTGIGTGALDVARKNATTLYDFKLFEGTHLIARLKPGVNAWDAQNEMRAVFSDPTVRVFPVRRIVMGDTHMLVTIWIIGWAVVLMRALSGLRKGLKNWRFHAYRLLTLVGLGSLLILLFSNVSEAFGSYRQVQYNPWFFWLWSLFYIMLSGVLLWMWRYDTRTRCRVCAHVLRLPMELGETSSMVLDAPRVELVCFEGHGALTMDRWHDDWRGYRDMWEAFSKPCM